jgi:hypothetical protein
MENLPETPAVAIGKNGYLIFTCNTVEELSSTVSAGLKDGTMYLHGNPFMFKDQVCQAIKFVAYG